MSRALQPGTQPEHVVTLGDPYGSEIDTLAAFTDQRTARWYVKTEDDLEHDPDGTPTRASGRHRETGELVFITSREATR